MTLGVLEESFAGSVLVSSISPVAIRMTWTALPITSAGRPSPRGPLGMISENPISDKIVERRRVNA
jgi:hypothetical protein